MRGVLRVDLRALGENVRKIRQYLPQNCQYISVLKANAYGLGAVKIAHFLERGSLIDGFAMANVDEALKLRDADIRLPIYILSPALPDEMPLLFEVNLIPLVSFREEVDRLELLAEGRERSLAIHIKIDTGMGRSGIWYDQVGDFARYIRTHCPHLQITGYATHYSSTATDPDFTAVQHQRFLAAISDESSPKLLLHASSSFGIGASFTEGTNAVRIGALQYAIPRGELVELLHLETVATFYGFVSGIKWVPKGCRIGYDQTYQLERDTKIALISLGYADGVAVQLSNRGHVDINNHHCRIIGRVSMDQAMVDVTDYPQIQIGDQAIFFGKGGPTLDEFAADADLPTRLCLCQISDRVARCYI
ncbi:MAG: alanine racemase [Opitutales bacterium]|nr:alanine racemase [Opitutales bacterium]